MINIGDIVEITRIKHGHKFKIGERVVVTKKWNWDNDSHSFCNKCDPSDLSNVFFQAENKKGESWTIGLCEIKKITI